ncbi:MAG: hypothetical protein OXM58_16355 [Rhodospirillaceae bacterium]|nr:hypothetical protein [Rhodospirillaceae bacterium]MDE0619846.1 hypothetical protein [Rhodospirillaceae bacterium]
MSGRHNFSDLTKEFAPERRERIEARVAELRANIALHKIPEGSETPRKAINDIVDVSRPASTSKKT